MIDIEQLRTTVIRPALQAILAWSPNAENLVLGTGLIESGYKYLRQIQGPAIGFWQMEPATHDDCLSNYVEFRGPLRAALRGLAKGNTAEEMAWNLRYAAAMCRIKYQRSPMSIPGNVAGWAKMWKQVYNSPSGAGKEQKFIDQWAKNINS